MILLYLLTAVAHFFKCVTGQCSEGFYTAEGASTQKVSIRMAFAIDNSGASYIGNELKATQFLGVVGQLSLNLDDYIYVVAYSDLIGCQGFLSEITQDYGGATKLFYTQDPEWKVSATGRYGQAPVSSTAQSFAELNTQIEKSNNGTTPSGGWKTPTAGPYNGQSCWSTIQGISSASRWIWYSSNGDPDPTTPGFNHQEYLIFRFRAGSGYPSNCLVCPLGFYCAINATSAQRCPQYTTNSKTGQSSLTSCIPFPVQIYQNLNYTVLSSDSSIQYYLAQNPPLYAGSKLYIKMECEQSYQQRMMGQSCENSMTFELKINMTGCPNPSQTWSQTYNIQKSSIGTYLSYDVPYGSCTMFEVKSALKIIGLHTEKDEPGSPESYVQATNAKEHHYRFLLKDSYNVAHDILNFQLSGGEGVLINYSPGAQSKYGTAEGDTFSFEASNRFTVFNLTDSNDTLIVNDTTWKENETKVPLFRMLGGNDSVQCYSPCTIYGNLGSNVYQLKGTKMTIKDFSPLRDTIDLRTTHSYLKHRTHLTSSKPNSTSLVITISHNESILLSPFDGNLTQVPILFDAPSCYLVCNNCTTERQCEQCSDCATCNTTHCVACNATHYLKEGRCVAECGENYLPNPEKPRECVYCNLDNCNGCPIANKCTVCEDNYVPDANSQCQRCNVTYFSTQGDQKCSKCGLGCDSCNKTQCFECSAGFLYAPKLSKQICYQNLAAGQTFDATSSQKVNSLQGSLIEGGLSLNQDGTITDIDAQQLIPSSLKKLDSMQVAKYFNEDLSSLFYTLDGSTAYGGRLLASSNIKQGTIYNIPLIKQNDPRWGGKPFGPRKTPTIANVGCLITCHSMILNACGVKLNSKTPNPDVVNDWLVSNQGFDANNDLKYDALDRFSQKFVTAKVTDINKILNYFRTGYVVFLNVRRTYRNGKESRQHWVAMVGENGQNVLIKDPYWDISQDSYDKIRWANIYQLQGGCSLVRDNINLNTYTKPFVKSSLNFQSCFAYSKLAQKSQYFMDAKSLMSSGQADLKLFTKIGSFSQIVKQQFIKGPAQITKCDQRDSAWKALTDFFGIQVLYDVLTFGEGGSQLCSLAMLLQSMGIKDRQGKFYVPSTIDEELVRQDAYAERQMQIKIAGITKNLKTKNHVDFSKVASKKLFGLTKEIGQIRNDDMSPLSLDQIQTLSKEIKTGKYSYIFEVLSSDGVGSQFVYSLNELSAAGIQVIDPATSTKRNVLFSQIIGYTKIARQRTFSAPELNKIHSFLSGESHYHAILTYQQSTLTTKKLPSKKFYLIKWQREEDTTLYGESFTVVDYTSGSFSREYQLSAIATFDQTEYILYSIDVYQNKGYLLDTTSLVANQQCTAQEVMAFVRMHQSPYSSPTDQTLVCFDTPFSQSSCQDSRCAPSFCRSTFTSTYNTLKSKLQNLLAALPLDDQDPRACALLKHVYYSQASTTTLSSAILPLFEEQAYHQVAYNQFLFSEAACVRMRPRQVSEVFYGMFLGKAPVMAQSSGLIDKNKVLEKIREIVVDGSKNEGKSQEKVGQAVCNAKEATCPQDIAKKKTTQELGLWLEEKGYLRSDLKIEEALPGDIIVFSGNKDNPFGHVAIRGDQGNIWYSDYIQRQGPYQYEASSFLVYN